MSIREKFLGRFRGKHLDFSYKDDQKEMLDFIDLQIKELLEEVHTLLHNGKMEEAYKLVSSLLQANKEEK